MPEQKLPKFYKNPKSLSQKLHNNSEKWWQKRGQAMALKLFRDMSKRVPAYKDFLATNNFDPKSVKSIDDFVKIPTIDKDNYLRKYPKEMLCWDGVFGEKSWVVSTTSGSTGQPYYFPRQKEQDEVYALTAEQYLLNNFDIGNKSTLYIIAFPMGAWIGGVFTYEAIKQVADKGKYKLSIITPGINKQEVINSVKQLSGSFDQTIIGAYAPFLKDILDDGEAQGVKWSDVNAKFIFSAEAFSETFRDYVADKVKTKDHLKLSLNHYGTVDMGTMAHETPESIMIRRELVSAGGLGLIFPEPTREPTLCQYNPELFYFEQQDNNLICSAYSGIPLVRYNLKDYGGVLNRQDILNHLGESRINIKRLSKKNIISNISSNLPYVYVYERKDFSVSYYAFLVYPEFVRRALLDEKLSEYISGKFSMSVDYDKNGRQKLHINVEQKNGNTKQNDLSKMIKNTVHEHLLLESSEYFETYKMVGEVVKPVIKVWAYEDPTFFKPGGKQKWVIK